jgi:hypothetical protein
MYCNDVVYERIQTIYEYTERVYNAYMTNI